MVTQGSDTPFQLDYRRAIATGRAVKRFNRDGGFHISKWTGPEDSCEWRLLVSQPARYRVLISYAAAPEFAARLHPPDRRTNPRSTGRGTGEGYRYRETELGMVELKKPGPLIVRLAPKDAGVNLMYLQRLVLRQVGGVAVE